MNIFMYYLKLNVKVVTAFSQQAEKFLTQFRKPASYIECTLHIRT